MQRFDFLTAILQNDGVREAFRKTLFLCFQLSPPTSFALKPTLRLRACLHGVGDPGLVGLVSFVFTLWRTQNKRNLPH